MTRVKVNVPVPPPAAPEPEKPSPVSTGTPPKQLKTIGLIILVGIVLILVFSLMRQRNNLQRQVNKLSANSSVQAEPTNQQYQQAVEKLVTVPAGVTPDIKVLSQDTLNQLGNDNLIRQTAQAGDVALLYKKDASNLFIVIYRPGNQKILIATPYAQGSAPAAASTKK